MTLQIDIAICTFQRPHLAETLRALEDLAIDPTWDVRVIVADNDAAPTAQAVVESAALSFPVTYLHAPARNISIARNACLDAARGDFVAFIDDDEIVTAGWLTALTAAAAGAAADVVLGPVQAVYSAACPFWMRDGDFHSSTPVWLNGRVISGGTGNVLLRRAALGATRFRPALGQTGGEDTAFFKDLESSGARFAIADEAIVHEAVPPARETLGWLLRRRFRYGQTHGMLLGESVQGYPGRLRHAVSAGVKTTFCIMMMALHMLSRHRGRAWGLRGALHAGAAVRLLRPVKGVAHG